MTPTIMGPTEGSRARKEIIQNEAIASIEKILYYMRTIDSDKIICEEINKLINMPFSPMQLKEKDQNYYALILNFYQNHCKKRNLDSDLSHVLKLKKIFSNFHRFDNQLRQKPHGKATISPLEIKNEYDIQHIMLAILKLEFDDIRPEEYTPSYAGSNSIIDFFLKNERIMIELKKTSDKLKDKDIGDQLIIDKERYRTHQNCDILYCFVYDPDRNISNPIGLENDLSEENEDLIVIVSVFPK